MHRPLHQLLPKGIPLAAPLGSPHSPSLLLHSLAGWLWTASAGGTPCFLICQSPSGDVALSHPQIQCCLSQHTWRFHCDCYEKVARLKVGFASSVVRPMQPLHPLLWLQRRCVRVHKYLGMWRPTPTPSLTSTAGWYNHQGASHLICTAPMVPAGMVL